MSSPGGSSNAFAQWTPESQSPSVSNNVSDGSEDGVSVRPMRLKVLYTFDDQNKTNCLARWPHVLRIQTVAMDEAASIGVVELKTCIQAIVQCSPELVATLGQDYAVYAYDYSEYDNPLVGQGMLSWALATASSTPDSSIHQSRQLVTGRVCKNILGLFTNGVKETLEVKLRLVPLPTVLQSEYFNAMDKYRELSKVIPAGFDHGEWTAFLSSNPNIAQMGSKTTPITVTSSIQRDGRSMEVVNQLLSPSLQQESTTDQFIQAANAENSGNESRSGGNSQKTSRPSSRTAAKRPRVKARTSKTTASGGGNTSGYEEGTDGDDGPAPKKRAKITKADWNSKSSFGPASDSLRVTASTAGSLRLFRPIAISPGQLAGSHLQDVPRAPTPVPVLPNQPVPHDRAPSQSGLRRDSFASLVEPPRKHISPYPPLSATIGGPDQVRCSIESANPSPERNVSPADTPPDISSSPPVMRTGTPLQSSPPCPSSPVLPQMPRTDSGFMSGSLEDLFGEDDDTTRPVNVEDVKVVTKYNKRRAPRPAPRPTEQIHHGFAIEEETPGPVELLPTRMPIIDPPKAAKATRKPPRARANSIMSEDGQTLPRLKTASRATPGPTPTQLETDVQQPVTTNASQEGSFAGTQHAESQQVLVPVSQPPPGPSSRPGSRMMVRTASMGSLTLPTITASDAVLPPSSLQQPLSWSEAPQQVTEAAMPTSFAGPAYSRTLNAKKAAIRQRLEMAIANGEMPPFCSNCGAIETPTWRKAWSQEFQGAPGYHEYSDEPGRVTAIVILGRDSEGKPTSYQLVKKFLLPEEDQKEYKQFLLCNPCGIWMSKYKTQRPEDKWESNRGTDRRGGREKRKSTQRPSRAKKSQVPGGTIPTSEAYFPQSDVFFPQSDVFFPQSDAFFPQSEAFHPQSEVFGPHDSAFPIEIAGATQEQTLGVQWAQLPCDRQRASSVHSIKRLHGTTSDSTSTKFRRAIQSSPVRLVEAQHSLIEDNDGFGSTRRLLFPSPRKDGSPKVLGEAIATNIQIATNFQSAKDRIIELPEKENRPQVFEGNDADAELMKLFEEEMAKPPSTPTKNWTESNPFKTPSRPTPSHRPITRSLSKSIRSTKSPGKLLVFAQRTPSRTPSTAARRRSPRNQQTVFESPFTATLNQLMHEANNHTQSPSRPSSGLQLDFGTLPDLPGLDGSTHSSTAEMNFQIEDFFSTDVPMPSSPPRLFDLYENSMALGNVDWNEFGGFDGKLLGGEDIGDELKDGTKEIEVKIESTPGAEELLGAEEHRETGVERQV